MMDIYGIIKSNENKNKGRYVTYRKMENAIQNKEIFHGNSVTAEINDGHYYINSYTTPILEIHGDHYGLFNNNGYSMTTSRLQNIIAGIYGLPTKRNGNKIAFCPKRCNDCKKRLAAEDIRK